MEALPIIILLVAMYAFLVIPQRRRQQAHKQLIASLEVGDVVVTNAGIHGAVAEVEDTVVWLEVAPDVELKVAKVAVAERIAASDDRDEAETVDEPAEELERADDES